MSEPEVIKPQPGWYRITGILEDGRALSRTDRGTWADAEKWLDAQPEFSRGKIVIHYEEFDFLAKVINR